MRAVVLGGYGLIGAACVRALGPAGFAVTGVGRSARAARASGLAVDWVIADIGRMSGDDWRALVAGADVVVNAAGALQDGARDDLVAVHVTAVERMLAALAGSGTRVVQISAAGVRAEAEAETAFFATKAQGDAALMRSGLDWVVLRPVLVLAPAAYGGTALLRAAASLPGVVPRVLPGAMVQCVHVDDLAAAVVAAAEGRVAAGTVAELTEAEGRSLPELIGVLRGWLGWAPARVQVPVPGVLLRGLSAGADLMGRLGWRSPLRSTAIAALEAGVTGDPRAWAAAGGAPCKSLEATLAAMPATTQDRWFARAWLAFPVAVGLLALFWTVSGLVGFWRFEAAAAVLTGRGVGPGAAALAVGLGSAVDVGLGLAILWRRWTAAVSVWMILVSLGYMAGALIVAPDLWADPLGPMVKVLPGIGLALFTALLAEDR